MFSFYDSICLSLNYLSINHSTINSRPISWLNAFVDIYMKTETEYGHELYERTSVFCLIHVVCFKTNLLLCSHLLWHLQLNLKISTFCSTLKKIKSMNVSKNKAQTTRIIIFYQSKTAATYITVKIRHKQMKCKREWKKINRTCSWAGRNESNGWKIIFPHFHFAKTSKTKSYGEWKIK